MESFSLGCSFMDMPRRYAETGRRARVEEVLRSPVRVDGVNIENQANRVRPAEPRRCGEPQEPSACPPAVRPPAVPAVSGGAVILTLRWRGVAGRCGVPGHPPGWWADRTLLCRAR